MSYIDPEYYNEEKLTEAQRAEIGCWRDMFRNAVENVLADMDGDTILEKMEKEIAEKVTASLLEYIESDISMLVVAMIDGAE